MCRFVLGFLVDWCITRRANQILRKCLRRVPSWRLSWRTHEYLSLRSVQPTSAFENFRCNRVLWVSFAFPWRWIPTRRRWLGFASEIFTYIDMAECYLNTKPPLTMWALLQLQITFVLWNDGSHSSINQNVVFKWPKRWDWHIKLGQDHLSVFTHYLRSVHILVILNICNI